MSKHKVTLWPSGQVVEVDSDKSLLEALKVEGIYIKSSCGGVASCSDCIVKVRSGKENLNAPTFGETKLLGNVFHITKERLSCQTQVCGEVEIDISGHDLSSDETRRRERTSKLQQAKFVIRKKDDQGQKSSSASAETPQGPNEGPKELAPSLRPPQKGGNKRPKTFSFDPDAPKPKPSERGPSSDRGYREDRGHREDRDHREDRSYRENRGNGEERGQSNHQKKWRGRNKGR